MSKEQNFVSAVVYVENILPDTLGFLRTLYDCLDEHFLQYEIVITGDAGLQGNHEPLRAWAKSLSKPLTIVGLSGNQPHEQCMNAGLDIAIGDYIYEFDSTVMTYSKDKIWQAYETAMQGYDIVTVCPKDEKSSSKLFYAIFNRHSGVTYKLRTDAFRLVSRRAVNRAHAMNENLPYRKAAYASCGLNSTEIEFSDTVKGTLPPKQNRIELAVDSLILYTNFVYRTSLSFSLMMLLGTATIVVYVLAVYLRGNPINGWTTTMLALTAGLTGVFAILTIILKYLSLILKLLFQKQSYTVDSVEKL